MAGEFRERDAFLRDLIAWLRDKQRDTLEEASSHTTLIRMLRGVTGRNMSIVWALNDYRPADGGPVLIERYAAWPELSESDRLTARGLAVARLDAYRVRSLAPGAHLETDALRDEAAVRLAWLNGFEHFQTGEILVGRVVHATSLPTLWGMCARFPAGGERRWRTRLATLPAGPARAALALLEVPPDDAAEPPPDGVQLHTLTWSIENDEAVLEELEDDDAWESLGQAIPDGWSFAWPDEAESGATDLGGWQEQPAVLEAARLIVREQHVILLCADPRMLRQVASHLEATLGKLIASGNESLAA